MICDFKESKLFYLPAKMELFIIYAKGVSPRVVIWPMELQSFTPMVGDVPKLPRSKEELVRMMLLNTWVG